MNAGRTVVGAALLAAGVLAPAARPDITVPTPPLPQPVAGLLSPSSGNSSAQSSQTTQSASTKPSVAAVPAFARSIVGEINRARSQYGLRLLRRSSALTTAAVAHATALATSGQFAHEWPDGRPFATWIPTFYSNRGFRTWSVGENLFWSTPGVDAATVVARWLG